LIGFPKKSDRLIPPQFVGSVLSVLIMHLVLFHNPVRTAARLWNSLPSHVTALPSPSSAVVLNHISSHFLIPLFGSSLICTVPAQ